MLKISHPVGGTDVQVLTSQHDDTLRIIEEAISNNRKKNVLNRDVVALSVEYNNLRLKTTIQDLTTSVLALAPTSPFITSHLFKHAHFSRIFLVTIKLFIFN